MSDYLDGKAFRKILLGRKVERAAAAVTIATTPYYHVYTGRVLLTGLVGEITVAAGAASNHTWIFDPTTGTNMPIAALLDIDPALVGDQLTITGLATDAMTYNASAAGLPMMTHRVVLPIGDLSLTMAAAEGSHSWTLFYIPIDDGAYVAAV